MFSRRKLALLATAALITGLIAGPAIAGGGDSSPDTAPAPAEPAPSPESGPSAPETPESEGADHDVNEICVGGDLELLGGDHPVLEFEPFEGFDLSPEDRDRLEKLESEFRAEIEKIEGLAADAFDVVEPDLDELEKALRDRDITVERTTTEDGMSCLQVNGDHEAFEAAMEEAFGDHFGELDGFGLDVFPDDFPGELPADLVEKVNAEMEALAEHFDELGIDYEIVEEGDLRLVEWDESDPAANAAAEEFLKDKIFDMPFFFDDEHFCEDEDGDSETGDDA